MIHGTHNQKTHSIRPAVLLCASVFLMIAPVGCRGWLPFTNKVRRIEPAMSMSIDRDTLVDKLNQQSAGLNGWRSHSTKLRVRAPGMPTSTLTGSIACKSPNYFRLSADNVFAKADLGSNASKCWAYTKPGEPAILTWNHEDTKLIQQLDLGVPFIDPDWLMLVLGITPLDASKYQLGPAPNGRPELWLTAMEQTPQGRRMKRIIKVDSIEGVVREHALYDENNTAVVQAILSSHRPHAGYLVPGQVRLVFPSMKTELTLSFKSIETNPMLPDQLWHMPDKKVRVVDLGIVARQHLLASGRQIAPAAGQTSMVSHASSFEEPTAEISQQSYERVTAMNQPTHQTSSASDNSFEAFMAAEGLETADDNAEFFDPNGNSSNKDNSAHNSFPMANAAEPEFDSAAGSWGDDTTPPATETLEAPDWDDPAPAPAPKPGFFGRMMGQ